MWASGHLDSTGFTGCVWMYVCVWVCVRGCECYKIFEMFEACRVDSADYTVCLCVSVSVSVSVLPRIPIWFSCVSIQSYKVVKGSSKSSTTEMRTVMGTTDIPATKSSKLNWREMWEIDVVWDSIMKEDLIEKDKDRSEYGWLTKMATCFKGSIGSLLAWSLCERINSCANQVLTLGNTLLGDGEMQKLVMCRMNRDFMVFMHKNYSQVADEHFEFGLLKAQDNEEKEDE